MLVDALGSVPMEMLTPEDRVVLWRSVVEAEGDDRRAYTHALAASVWESLSALGLHGDEHKALTVESLETLDDAGLFGRDRLRRAFEALHEDEGGVDALVAELAGLLREASGAEHLEVDRRVRAIEMASEWREQVLQRERRQPEWWSVGDVAARFGVTTQAVYKWLQKGRVEGERTPGGSWRIPVAQFQVSERPSIDRRRLDELQARLTRKHAGAELPSEESLTAGMRHAD
jgi:excisionase family DNA binding protein